MNKYREYVVCATMAPCDLKIRSKIIDRRYGEKLLWNIFQLGNNVITIDLIVSEMIKA